MKEDANVFVWNDCFVTGYAAVDAQHHRLVDLLNGMARRLGGEAPPDKAEVDALLAALASYAATHFADEERLMSAAGIDGRHYDGHVKAHRDFVRHLGVMVDEARLGVASTLELLVRFLASWLAYHILGTDLIMARQLRRIEAGESPQAAYANEAVEHDGAAAVLLTAVGRLYDVASVRAAALAEARGGLQAMNLALENKVDERTARLAEANALLERERAELRATLDKFEQAQRQLLQSEKLAAIGQLAAGVAHEINNPVGFVNSNLGTLKTYVDRLLDLVAAGEAIAADEQVPAALRERFAAARKRADLDYLMTDVHDLLAESTEGLDRVKRIVADLKDFSHIDEAEWQDADINRGIESTLNVVNNELKYKATVVKDLSPLPPVRCRPAQINQVLMNLLVNAAHAIEVHGTITIRTRHADAAVEVSIADTGKGIPPEIIGRIFEPFFTTKPIGQGTGLGLSIACDIIGKHEGSISVDSTPGQGATFTLRLPLLPSAAIDAGDPS